MKIEICATSLKSVINAQNAGADRIELCENYLIGGVTPKLDFLRSCIKTSNIPINVLIRPRGGKFIFSDDEFNLMINSIYKFKEYNINGFVIGFHDQNKNLDDQLLKEFRKITKGYELVFHRAFDYLKNQEINKI